MDSFLCNSLYILSISLAIWLVLGIALHVVIGKKYADPLLGLPKEKKEKLIRISERTVKTLKIVLCLLPALSVPALMGIYFYERVIFSEFAVVTSLVYVSVLELYIFRKWVLKHYQKKDFS